MTASAGLVTEMVEGTDDRAASTAPQAASDGNAPALRPSQDHHYTTEDDPDGRRMVE